MPSRPPNLRKSQPRKAWAGTEKSKRLRGRAGVRDRQRILAEEPLCRECAKADRVVASQRVDHIIPLSQGGSDERGNKQALCVPCHDAKSKAERAVAAARR